MQILKSVSFHQRHRLEGKQGFDGHKQVADLLHQHGQDHHQPCQGGHHGLILPARADQQLVEHCHDDPDGCDFENEIDLQSPVISFAFYSTSSPSMAPAARPSRRSMLAESRSSSLAFSRNTPNRRR